MEIKRIKRAKKEAGSASYPQEKRDGTQTVCSSNDCQNTHRQIDKTEEPKVFLEQCGTLCGREPHPSCPPPRGSWESFITIARNRAVAASHPGVLGVFSESGVIANQRLRPPVHLSLPRVIPSDNS